MKRQSRRFLNPIARFTVVLTAACLCLWTSILDFSLHPTSFLLHPANAQIVRTENVWQQVYQRLPDLPRENQYISKETGKAATENTLVSRLIRYHVYVKSRPPNYRLDWKLTLADYLGANELIVESVYPGYDSLRKNPLEGDRAAVSRMNRAQRDALVQVLVSFFGGNAQNATTPPPSTSSPAPQATPQRRQLPQPGDAQLLKHEKLKME